MWFFFLTCVCSRTLGYCFITSLWKFFFFYSNIVIFIEYLLCDPWHAKCFHLFCLIWMNNRPCLQVKRHGQMCLIVPFQRCNGAVIYLNSELINHLSTQGEFWLVLWLEASFKICKVYYLSEFQISCCSSYLCSSALIVFKMKALICII